MTGVGGRPEIIVEGSNDMSTGWKEYDFLYKPGNVTMRPAFVGKLAGYRLVGKHCWAFELRVIS